MINHVFCDIMLIWTRINTDLGERKDQMEAIVEAMKKESALIASAAQFVEEKATKEVVRPHDVTRSKGEM